MRGGIVNRRTLERRALDRASATATFLSPNSSERSSHQDCVSSRWRSPQRITNLNRRLRGCSARRRSRDLASAVGHELDKLSGGVLPHLLARSCSLPRAKRSAHRGRSPGRDRVRNAAQLFDRVAFRIGAGWGPLPDRSPPVRHTFRHKFRSSQRFLGLSVHRRRWSVPVSSVPGRMAERTKATVLKTVS